MEEYANHLISEEGIKSEVAAKYHAQKWIPITSETNEPDEQLCAFIRINKKIAHKNIKSDIVDSKIGIWKNTYYGAWYTHYQRLEPITEIPTPLNPDLKSE